MGIFSKFIDGFITESFGIANKTIRTATNFNEPEAQEGSVGGGHVNSDQYIGARENFKKSMVVPEAPRAASELFSHKYTTKPQQTNHGGRGGQIG